MQKEIIPADFPRACGVGAVSGDQPKALLHRENGVLRIGAGEEIVASRYKFCADLVEQLNAYCTRKLEEHPDWTVEANLERAERGLRQKVSTGVWPLFEAEVLWIMGGVEVRQTEQAGRLRTIQKLLHKLEWHTREQLWSLIQENSQDQVTRLQTWEKEQKIFSVCHHGQELYPKFQFDENYEPVTVMQTILEIFSAKDAWAVASWFAFPNGWISEEHDKEFVSVAPMDVLLTRAEEVVDAARKALGTHFA